MNRIYPQMWLDLPKEVRLHLIFVFNLVRTGISEVRDQTVISDGFTIEDLGEITLEKMCEYIGSQETFARAWEITLAKVHSELHPPVIEIRRPDGVVEIHTENEGNFPSEKKPDSIVVDEASNVDEEISEIKMPPMVNISTKDLGTAIETPGVISSEMKPPFCDSCESKGVRHLKDCPKFVTPKSHENI